MGIWIKNDVVSTSMRRNHDVNTTSFYVMCPLGDTLVMIQQILKQFNGNNSYINDAILIKLDVHHHVQMMQINYKFLKFC